MTVFNDLFSHYNKLRMLTRQSNKHVCDLDNEYSLKIQIIRFYELNLLYL